MFRCSCRDFWLMSKGVRSHTLRLPFILRLDRFGTGWRVRLPFAELALAVLRELAGRCSCGRPIPEEVTRCSSRTCPEYAPTWARDTRRRRFVNLEQLKQSVTFSVTAPGADLYPFDPHFCSHPPGERCSGSRGCRVNPEMAIAFNRRAGKWCGELHRAAKV